MTEINRYREPQKEDHHPEAAAQERHLEGADVGLGIQESQPPLGAGHIQECADDGAGDGANAADDHDQQNLVGHGGGKGLGLGVGDVHGEQRAAHAGEKAGNHEGDTASPCSAASLWP